MQIPFYLFIYSISSCIYINQKAIYTYSVITKREREMRRECHPLLKGVRENSKYKHGFSAAEIESLTSICEVVLPPLPIDALKIRNDDDDDDNDVQSFWNSSASRYPIPHEVHMHIYI